MKNKSIGQRLINGALFLSLLLVIGLPQQVKGLDFVLFLNGVDSGTFTVDDDLIAENSVAPIPSMSASYSAAGVWNHPEDLNTGLFLHIGTDTEGFSDAWIDGAIFDSEGTGNVLVFAWPSLNDFLIVENATEEIIVSGPYTVHRDSDGDGVPDSQDACPNSILTETVILAGCDSGVENLLFEDGCTLSDLIEVILNESKNRGQFLRGVNQLGKDLVRQGIISKNARTAVLRCAAKS